jgi:DNA polymerase I-like protein with 3'-5' exonuclease and polymerase domains
MPLDAALLDRERDFAKAFRPAALRGVRLDPAQVARLTLEHRESREAARRRAEELSEGQIQNPKSATQVAPYLASTGRYELPRSEKTGKPGAPKGVLEQYAHTGDELAEALLQYRRDDTALGLLLEPRRALLEHGDGRVRTSILTLAANTGRTSSRNENLQQISRQGGMRACHLADPGCLIISADFSSVEVRVGAALSGDSSMQELIRLGDLYPERKKEFDFHWRTAVTCYGPDATYENRYNSKRINFAKMYGSGKKSAAGQVGIPLQEVSNAFDAFDVIAPGYKLWDQWMRDQVRAGMKSYPTYSGRDIWLTGKAEHAAGNAAIQGTAREFLVDAVAKWEQGPWAGHTVIPVHDEVIIFNVPEDQADEATAYLTWCMETELMGVKIRAEANKPSPFWMDASLQPSASWHLPEPVLPRVDFVYD